MSNNVRTFFLMTVLTVLFVWIGGEVGGKQGAFLAFLAAAAMNFFAYWFSDKLVLKQYRAQEAETDSRLYRIVESLIQTANLPMPKVYIIPEQTPNAFATGRNPQHAAVAATEGILNILDDDELAGVMAHELTHVRHRDILTGTIAATLAGPEPVNTRLMLVVRKSRTNHSDLPQRWKKFTVL
jgi:heat shock protein HtpX